MILLHIEQFAGNSWRLKICCVIDIAKGQWLGWAGLASPQLWLPCISCSGPVTELITSADMDPNSTDISWPDMIQKSLEALKMIFSTVPHPVNVLHNCGQSLACLVLLWESDFLECKPLRRVSREATGMTRTVLRQGPPSINCLDLILTNLHWCCIYDDYDLSNAPLSDYHQAQFVPFDYMLTLWNLSQLPKLFHSCWSHNGPFEYSLMILAMHHWWSLLLRPHYSCTGWLLKCGLSQYGGSSHKNEIIN